MYNVHEYTDQTNMLGVREMNIKDVDCITQFSGAGPHRTIMQENHFQTNTVLDDLFLPRVLLCIVCWLLLDMDDRM